MKDEWKLIQHLKVWHPTGLHAILYGCNPKANEVNGKVPIDFSWLWMRLFPNLKGAPFSYIKYSTKTPSAKENSSLFQMLNFSESRMQGGSLWRSVNEYVWGWDSWQERSQFGRWRQFESSESQEIQSISTLPLHTLLLLSEPIQSLTLHIQGKKGSKSS